jgi:D-alanine-D-alanine ligase
VDVAFNIAEGRKGRYRESQIPALLELMDIEFTGSEAGSLAVCHDKALAKRLVSQAGVGTARCQVMQTGAEPLKGTLSFPLLVKPVAEGSSKGVALRSVANDEKELREVVKEMIARYAQPALVEEFLPGREFTVGLLGEKKLKVLPIMEICFHSSDPHPIYSFKHKQGDDSEVRFQVPAKVEPAFQKRLEKAARLSFQALGCRDVARVDFRLNERDEINFIECNPLPGLSPGYSDLCIIAQAAGMGYRDLVGHILAPAIRRHKIQKRSEL